MGIYQDYVIPLTKEVEVAYLMQRLRFVYDQEKVFRNCQSNEFLSPVSVAFLGPKASYSHQAALKYFKGQTPELLECSTFAEVHLCICQLLPACLPYLAVAFNQVFQSVLSNKTIFGIVPIENSTTGRIHQVSLPFPWLSSVLWSYRVRSIGSV